MKAKKLTRHMGRPRGFNTEKALESAMRVFWQKGYEGTSLSDLTKAMKINRPSLYAAFGDKESLFHQVLERYAKGPAGYVRGALSEPTARKVVEKMLYESADLLSDPHNPRGCLLVQGALACGKDAGSAQQEVTALRIAGEDAIRKRFNRAKAEGDLPADSDPSALARYVSTVAQGMSVQAASGASRDELRRVAQIALQAWPSR